MSSQPPQGPMPDVPPGVPEEDMHWLEAGLRDPEADALYEGPDKPKLCKYCGGPRSLAVHSAFLSGVGVADHEFQPEE